MLHSLPRYAYVMAACEALSGHVIFVMENVALTQGFSPGISISPANSHSTNCSIFINHATSTVYSYSIVSESELLYDWRFNANQFVLTPSP
jgi:hypothetical protein